LTVASAYHQGDSWLILKGHLTEYLSFMNEYHLNPDTPFIQSWTIGIEQKFYLVWPLALVLVGLLSRRLRIPLCIAAIALVTIRWNTYLAGNGIRYSVLLIGALLALVLHSPRGFALLRPLTHPVAGAVLLAGVVYLHLSLPVLITYFHSELQPIFLYGLAIALLIPSLLGPGIGKAVLTLRPLVFIGERSYGLYLFQMLAATLVAALLPDFMGKNPTLTAVLVVLAALAIADLTHHRLEQPMIHLGRRLIRTLDGSKKASPLPHGSLPEQSAMPEREFAPTGQ
jgi:peptidoglycan/LPS O-acetylase OafA/YrhL